MHICILQTDGCICVVLCVHCASLCYKAECVDCVHLFLHLCICLWYSMSYNLNWAEWWLIHSTNGGSMPMGGNEQTHCMALRVLHVVSFHFLIDRIYFEQPCQTLKRGERLQGSCRPIVANIIKSSSQPEIKYFITVLFHPLPCKGQSTCVTHISQIRTTDFKCNTRTSYYLSHMSITFYLLKTDWILLSVQYVRSLAFEPLNQCVSLKQCIDKGGTHTPRCMKD